MVRRPSVRLVAMLVALAVPLPALAACGSALFESPCHQICRMLLKASGHCEGTTGLTADCCTVDRNTARNQVSAAPAPGPGKPDLAVLPASAQPALALRAASARALWTPPLEPRVDVSLLRTVVLLI